MDDSWCQRSPIIIQSTCNHLLKKFLFTLNRVWSVTFSTDAQFSNDGHKLNHQILSPCTKVNNWVYIGTMILTSTSNNCLTRSKCYWILKIGLTTRASKMFTRLSVGTVALRWSKCSQTPQVIYKKVMWWSSSLISGRRGMWLWGPIDVQC